MNKKIGNELQVIENNEIITKDKIIEYVKTFLPTQLNENEVKQFVEIATAFQLNPFKREIYCVAYGEGQYRKLSIITGYEVYLKRAERIGKLDGWDCEIVGELKSNTMKAVLTIYRKDWTKPFRHEAYFDECKQVKKDGGLNSMWTKMPKFMLKKVCIAQGFRLCFSDEFGGMPYTDDELPENMITVKPDAKEGIFNKIKDSESVKECPSIESDPDFENIDKGMNEFKNEIEANEKKKEILTKALTLKKEKKLDKEADTHFKNLFNSNRIYTKNEYDLDLEYIKTLEKNDGIIFNQNLPKGVS